MTTSTESAGTSELWSYADYGTAGNVSDPVTVGSGLALQDVDYLFAGVNPEGENCIFAVNQIGQLSYFLDDGTPGNVTGAAVIGYNPEWQGHAPKFLFGGTNDAGQTGIYAVNNEGQLLLYGSAILPNVSQAVVVGDGAWLEFQFLWAGANAVGVNCIYAVDTNEDSSGQLLAYLDNGLAGNVSDPTVVGFGGWMQFPFLFAGANLAGENRIYAVDDGGRLLAYTDSGTPGNVSDPAVVGFGGWRQFKYLFAGRNTAGENRIYAVPA